jgi:DNA invertase Pin-like site-specific DNA recombinase
LAHSVRNTLRDARGTRYRDEGVSGAKDLEDLPAFVEMMTALHTNGVKLVLVEKLDRLARDLMVQEAIIGDLRKNGFELISVCMSRTCCRTTQAPS